MIIKRYQFPARMGGGDFVMRETLSGALENDLKNQAGAPRGQEVHAVLDGQAKLICESLDECDGKPVPKAGAERDAWWEGQTSARRSFLIGIYEMTNQARAKEIEEAFGAGVIVTK